MTSEILEIHEAVGTPVGTAIKNAEVLKRILAFVLRDVLGTPGIAMATQIDYSDTSITGLLVVLATRYRTLSSRSNPNHMLERKIAWDVRLLAYDSSPEGNYKFDVATERIERKFPGSIARLSPIREDAYRQADIQIINMICTSLG
jgi:hypothetical protein